MFHTFHACHTEISFDKCGPLRDMLTECAYGMRLWDELIGCAYGMRLPDALTECTYRMLLTDNSHENKSGLIQVIMYTASKPIKLERF